MVLKGKNFLFVSGLLTDGMMRLNVINVYAPQNNGEKKALWDKITLIIQRGQGWWIVLGDFNAVRDPSERKKSFFDPVSARDFNDFVDNTGLREYDLKGLSFTYFANRCGVCKLSRIDRVFVCDSIFNKWPSACVRALKREHSDHAPLCLTLIDTNFGPKPFRWFDSWLDRPGCEDVVKNALLEWQTNGSADLKFTKKMGMLRAKLKMWIQDTRFKENEDFNRLKKEQEDMELLMEQKDLDEVDLWVWAECKKSLEEIELFRSREMIQKSRVKWAALGDENTSLFHSIVNGRKARNSIPGLDINGEWVSKPL
ncbi:uncharacterized protein LOC110880779 [Helianthus annuus]|uniref:uncharacterized protein LOC110880779 n=1 Tax=Helianthus annuus TaxID=4232 RepID=UPI000B903119|nr:uncharacterized protein LOC110880779 [Helianthus annuus]